MRSALRSSGSNIQRLSSRSTTMTSTTSASAIRSVMSSASVKRVVLPKAVARARAEGSASSAHRAAFAPVTGASRAAAFSTHSLDELDAVPLSQSPHQDLKQLGARFALGECPTCNEAKDRHGAAHECAICGFPTHCCEEHHAQDKAHAELCDQLRIHNADLHDLRVPRKRPELRFPPFTQPSTLENGWGPYLEQRGFTHWNSDRVVRYLSASLTYPLTIASQLQAAANARYGLGATLDRRFVRIVLLGARAEAHLPHAHWLELAKQFPTTNFALQIVGPEVPEDAHEQCGFLSKAAKIDGRPNGQSFKLHFYSSVYDADAHKALSAEVGNEKEPLNFYVGLNTGIGQPLGYDSWKETLDIIMSTGDPFLLTSFDQSDLNADQETLKRICLDCDWWLEPTRNPFASMRTDVDVRDGAKVINSSWGMIGVKSRTATEVKAPFYERVGSGGNV